MSKRDRYELIFGCCFVYLGAVCIIKLLSWETPTWKACFEFALIPSGINYLVDRYFILAQFKEHNRSLHLSTTIYTTKKGTNLSVQTNQYILLGIKLPFEAYEYKQIEEYCDSAYDEITHHKGLCVIYDGMNGKYIYIGRVLYKSEVNEQLEGHIALERVNESQVMKSLKDSIAKIDYRTISHSKSRNRNLVFYSL